MKISAKARYGLFSIIEIASLYEKGEFISLISLSEKLKISKIYLEQVFASLKKSGLVISAKGAQGGYKLSKKPEYITVFEVIYSLEYGLFEKTEKTLEESLNINPEIAIEELVYKPLDLAIKNTLDNVTLKQLVDKHNKGYMYYI